MVQTGEKIPNITLDEGQEKIKIAETLQDKKAVLVGVPGAFTPTCHRQHVPGFIEKFNELKGKGIDYVGVVSVNDAMVMGAWKENLKAPEDIHFLADPRAEFVKALNLSFDATQVLGNERSRRFAMVVNKGVVENLKAEETGELQNSTVDKILQEL